MKLVISFLTLIVLSGCSFLGSSGTVFHTFEGLTNAEFYNFEKYGGTGANVEVASLTEQVELDALKKCFRFCIRWSTGEFKGIDSTL